MKATSQPISAETLTHPGWAFGVVPVPPPRNRFVFPSKYGIIRSVPLAASGGARGRIAALRIFLSSALNYVAPSDEEYWEE
jgi:hypothetical protein